MIEAKNLTKVYGRGRTEVKVLTEIDFTLAKGEFVAIQGPSGCGKSTLLHILGCLEKPDSGVLMLDSVDVGRQNDRSLAKLRREKIGFVFQSFNLMATMSAVLNVKLPMLFAGVPDTEAHTRAATLLSKLGMEGRLHHKPSELSGGEQQRVAIARALANEPLLIIGDEPTGNLDSKSGAAVLEIFTELNKQGQTIVIVTHDQAVANRTHRVLHMRDGRFV